MADVTVPEAVPLSVLLCIWACYCKCALIRSSIYMGCVGPGGPFWYFVEMIGAVAFLSLTRPYTNLMPPPFGSWVSLKSLTWVSPLARTELCGWCLNLRVSLWPNC